MEEVSSNYLFTDSFLDFCILIILWFIILWFYFIGFIYGFICILIILWFYLSIDTSPFTSAFTTQLRSWLGAATMRGQGGTQFKLVQYLQTCIYVRHSYLYHISLLSPRHVVQHDHINASRHAQSVMGPGCSNNHKGCELCIIANRHNQELR